MEAIKLIKDRSCKNYSENPDLVDKVYCCDGKKGVLPSECKMKELENRKNIQVTNVKGNYH